MRSAVVAMGRFRRGIARNEKRPAMPGAFV